MKFANELSKLLTNKYFLYFIVFLSVTNVLGYLVNNKIHAVIFFALVSFLMANFSKNMVVILLVALVSTNLLMANKTMREGMEQMEKGEDDMEGQEMEEDGMDNEEMDEADEENYTNMGATKPVKKDDKKNDRKNDKKKAKKIVKRNDKKKEPEPVKKAETFGNKHASQLKNAAPVDGDEDTRIDYASTLEGAYDNLDKILGSEGINKLTGDTQKLMAQQQKLFDSMQNMAPMIQNAKEMLSGFDMKGLGDLANMAKGLQSQPAPVIPK